jgi:SAM-dependent methyltransferase
MISKNFNWLTLISNKFNMIKNIISKFQKKQITNSTKIDIYIKNGRVPWSDGYSEYKNKIIEESIISKEVLFKFCNKTIKEYGIGLDERCVEYPWIFSKITNSNEMMLDAGSTFNFNYILNNENLKNKNLTIFTFYPEKDCFYNKRISYVYGDLRKMYFNNCVFDFIVSQSTIEHIDMDNSIYGYSDKNIRTDKSYDYLKAVYELERVLKSGGKLLITVPFGKFENHGFFQQFDNDMLDRMTNLIKDKGTIELDFFKYDKQGWRFAKREELNSMESFNPHTGKGKLDDGAAHCRSIVCMEFNKF